MQLIIFFFIGIKIGRPNTRPVEQATAQTLRTRSSFADNANLTSSRITSGAASRATLRLSM